MDHIILVTNRLSLKLYQNLELILKGKKLKVPNINFEFSKNFDKKLADFFGEARFESKWSKNFKAFFIDLK